jgi:putative transposase
MTETLDDVSARKKPVEQQAAAELVRLAREQGLSLTGPDGLLKQLTKTVLESALTEEMTEQLGHQKHQRAGSGNIRNGARAKTVLTEHSGHCRDRCSPGSGRDVRTSDRPQTPTPALPRR